MDLLKLLGLDSSFATRKALATELGCPADKMGDSANMNMWLHVTVLSSRTMAGTFRRNCWADLQRRAAGVRAVAEQIRWIRWSNPIG